MAAETTLRCYACGYDMLGLYEARACPECGSPEWSAAPTDRGERRATVAGVCAYFGLIVVFFGVPLLLVSVVLSVWVLVLRNPRPSRHTRRSAIGSLVCSLLLLGFYAAFAVFFL